MLDKKSRELIKKTVGIGYKRGFLDGMNFQIATGQDYDEEITRKEFEELGVSDIIDEAIKKVKP